MFRPNVAIIRFTSESMVVLLYRIGMGMSRWWDLSICDVCYMLFIGGTGGGDICDVRYPGGALVCLLAAVLCGSPATVCPYPMSTSGGLLLWVVCALYPSYLWWSLCPVRFVCACTCLPSKGCRIWRFGDRVPDWFGNYCLALRW